MRTSHSRNVTCEASLDDFLAPYASMRRKQANKLDKGRQHSADESINKIVLSIFEVPSGLLAPSAASALSQDATDVSIVSADDAEGKQQSRRGLTCLRCGLTFDARLEQLAHFKSELHMTNLRRHLAGKSPVAAADCLYPPATTSALDSQAGPRNAEEDGSSTGSDDDIIDGDDDEDDAFDAAEHELGDEAFGPSLKSAAGDGTVGERRVRVDHSLQGGPRVTFTPAGTTWCFSLSTAALGMERGSDPWEKLASLMGEGSDRGGGDRLWAVIMLRSGKFAAAVFEGQSVMCHKVFRRRATRLVCRVRKRCYSSSTAYSSRTDVRLFAFSKLMHKYGRTVGSRLMSASPQTQRSSI